MSAGGIGFSYDARGNLTSDGTNSFIYNSENLMTDGPGGAKLKYDALGRLQSSFKTGQPFATRFEYDGADLIVEFDAPSTVLRRFVHGPGIDNPIAWYEGSAVSSTTRRFLMADERGSVVSITDSAGATININSYDEYGIPAPGNLGRFGYTGQTWLPEIGMWYYKARLYSPTLGRFMQTDPIGYADGMNWYNYVDSDPVNFTDPLGLEEYAWPPIDVVACSDGSQPVPDKRYEGGYRCDLMPSFKSPNEVTEGGGGGMPGCYGYVCSRPPPPAPPLPCKGYACKPKPPKVPVLPDCSAVKIPAACRNTGPVKHWHDDVDLCEVAKDVGTASAYGTAAGAAMTRVPYPPVAVAGGVLTAASSVAGAVSGIGSHLAGCP